MVPCEICGQQYVRTSHKKQHLVCHFKEKLSADLKSTSSSSDFVKNYQIYKCPFNDCQYKSLEKWPTLQHYGIVHNIVDMYLKDYYSPQTLEANLNPTFFFFLLLLSSFFFLLSKTFCENQWIVILLGLEGSY